jgi:hypothetical protein
MIFEPFVMMFDEPFVFAPRPALVPLGTAANTAAVGGKPAGTV